MAFVGVLVGLAIPLAVSLSISTSIRDIAIWGVATVVLQLLAFRVVDMLLTGLPQRIEKGEVAAVDDAGAWAALARSWLSLREAFDEGCAVRPRALAGLSELPAVDVDDEGTFWRQLLDAAL